MPLIINAGFFVNDLEIPNAVAQPAIGTNTPNKQAPLNDCIDYTEKNVLLNALGLQGFNALKAALPLTDSSDQKWIDLVNGKEYDGKVWEGLSNSKSLLAYATYYEFLRSESQYWAVTGIVKSESANATNVSPSYKLATASQVFISKYQNGFCEYPHVWSGHGWELVDWYGIHETPEVSLYEFLRDHADVYEWKPEYFKHYETVNTFGL